MKKKLLPMLCACLLLLSILPTSALISDPVVTWKDKGVFFSYEDWFADAVKRDERGFEVLVTVQGFEDEVWEGMQIQEVPILPEGKTDLRTEQYVDTIGHAGLYYCYDQNGDLYNVSYMGDKAIISIWGGEQMLAEYPTIGSESVVAMLLDPATADKVAAVLVKMAESISDEASAKSAIKAFLADRLVSRKDMTLLAGFAAALAIVIFAVFLFHKRRKTASENAKRLTALLLTLCLLLPLSLPASAEMAITHYDDGLYGDYNDTFCCSTWGIGSGVQTDEEGFLFAVSIRRRSLLEHLQGHRHKERIVTAEWQEIGHTDLRKFKEEIDMGVVVHGLSYVYEAEWKSGIRYRLLRNVVWEENGLVISVNGISRKIDGVWVESRLSAYDLQSDSFLAKLLNYETAKEPAETIARLGRSVSTKESAYDTLEELASLVAGSPVEIEQETAD